MTVYREESRVKGKDRGEQREQSTLCLKSIGYFSSSALTPPAPALIVYILPL